MNISEIQSYIGEIENDPSLYEEKNFDKRIEIIEFFEFQLIDCVEDLQRQTTPSDELILLKNRVEKVKAELEEINVKLFQKLRAKIRTGEYTGQKLKDFINEYTDLNMHQEHIGYDNLDIFINGLISFQPIPEQTKELEPEMVFYQKTPARIVFELTEKIQFYKDDVFIDLGSGLGQVAILVNLLTGVTAKGVELEPTFCDYARDSATALNLCNVTFINTDARKADYSEGTVFFMYTPFTGKMLHDVLDILRKESLKRKIRLITHGPCTAQVASQSWLNFEEQKNANAHKLAVFTNL